MIREKSAPGLLETNIFYLVEGLVLIFLGGFFQSRDIYSGLLITQYLIILLPTILYLKIKGYKLKKILRINRISLKQIVIIPLIVIFAYPLAVFLNYLFILLLSNFMEIKPSPIPIPQNTKEFILSLIIISISPAICEEVLFRGMIMSTYDRLGKKSAIIISSILFGIYHFNIQNLLGPIFLGVIFGYMVYKTRSIFASMIAHGVNNAIALSISYFIVDKIEGISVESTAINTYNESLVSILSFGAFAIISAFISIKLYKALPEGEGKDKVNFGVSHHRFVDYIPIFIVLIVFIVFNYLVFI